MLSEQSRSYHITRLLSLAFVVLTFLVSDVQSYCFEDRLPIRTDLPEVTILQGGWDSQIVISMLGKILLQEKMGVDIKWFPTEKMAEYWNYDVDYPYTYKKWFADEQVDIGLCMGGYHVDGPLIDMLHDGTLISNTIGVKENVGFFFPKYMNDEFFGMHYLWLRNSSSARARLIEDAAFPTSLPPVYGSFPQYMMTKQTIKMIKALSLNINFTLLGNEEKLRKVAQSLYNDKKVFIIQHYTPTYEFALFDLERVAFPFNPSGQNSDECFLEARCGWLDEPLFAVVHSKLLKKLPETVAFARRFSLGRTAVNEIIKLYNELATGYYIPSEWEAAVCKWLKANPERWENWIQTIPPSVPLWLVIVQYAAATIGFLLLLFLCYKLWKMTKIKAADDAQPVSEIRKRGLYMEYSTHIIYIVMDLFDVAFDVWAVGTIFSIDGVTLLLAVCYTSALVVSLIYTTFMFSQRTKYIMAIKKELTGAVETDLRTALNLDFGEGRRKYINEVLVLLSGLLEDVPSIVLNLIVWNMGFFEPAFMVCLFFSLLCFGVKSSGLEKMAIYSGLLSKLKRDIKYIPADDKSVESKGSKKSN